MPQNLLCFCLDWAYECPGPLDIDQKPFISEACVAILHFELHGQVLSLIQIITKGEQMLNDNLPKWNEHT